MSHDAFATPRLFPLFADLHDRTVLVVGGGVVARRKVEALMGTGARIVVGAPALDATLAEWLSEGRIAHRRGRFHADWLEDAWLAIAATDDPDVNREVAEAGEARRVWVNVVDDAAVARVHLPARIERGPVQIAISSGGGAPMLARLLRERLETELDDSIGMLATFLTRHRDRIRDRWPDGAARRRAFSSLLSGPLQGLLRKRRHIEAERMFDAFVEDGNAVTATGSVALVGAGPGDAGLLTLRALRVMNEADVILHDNLVSDDVLQLARRDAERIPVGKQSGGRSTSQQEINALLVEHARLGKRVVRLKGGDPFVFGRGGEELEALRDAGIGFEVVPGITAATACAAYAGIPLTHREHAQSLRLVTAHAKASLDTLDWAALAQGRQTLAVYMGVAMLDTLRERLLAHGRDAGTPFALVENGSRTDQRVITGILADLPETARLHDVRSPALLILGEVAAFARTLHWFGARPLGAGDAPTALDVAA